MPTELEERSFFMAKGQVAHHKHDAWAEHPVAVEYHQEWFSNLSSVLNKQSILMNIQWLLDNEDVVESPEIIKRLNPLTNYMSQRTLSLYNLYKETQSVKNKTRLFDSISEHISMETKTYGNTVEEILNNIVSADNENLLEVEALKFHLVKLPLNHLQGIRQIVISEVAVEKYRQKLSARDPRGIVGVYDPKEKIIAVKPGFYKEAIHEVGHYVFDALMSVSDKNEIIRLYQESIRAKRDFITSYSKVNYKEYAAENYRAYAKDKNMFRKKNPLLATIFDKYWR